MASTWAATESNETVSFNNLQNAVNTGYFQALATIPASNEQITKADASSLVSIDTAFASYAAKASNQLVVKSNLRPIFQFSGTFYHNIDSKGWFGWSSSSNACPNYSGASSATVNWNGSLTNGTVVFIPNCTLDLGSVGFYVIVYAGVAYWLTFSYQYFDATTNRCAYSVTSIGTCVSSTSYQAKYGSDLSTICSQSEQTVYIISSAAFTTGTTVYSDAALTIPLSGNIYISETLSGTIWNINSSTGVIGTSTGNIC
jgi:hypothetical protein